MAGIHVARRGGVGRAPGLLKSGNFQSYAADPYSASTSMWGLNDPARDQLVADSSMRVFPSTFPDGTVFTWDVTPDPDVSGVNGYLHVDYGNYDWSPGVITPRQVYTITALSVNVAWTFSGNASSGLLSECWLSPVSAASGDFAKSHEIAFFPRSSSAATAWLGTLPLLGSYTDSNGVAWEVREGVSGVDDVPYLVSYRPGYVDFQGALLYADLFAFLVSTKKITGNEWFNGVAFGVEPNSGIGSLTVDQFTPTYTGAARVPWTVTDLAATALSGTSASLTWTAAPGATSHQYRVNGGAWTATSAASSHTVTGLTAGTAYTFEVRGVNSTGNGAPSNTASATTTGGAVNVITNGGFDDDTEWSGAWFSGKTISEGTANFAASPTFDGFWQNPTLVAGKYYELTFTVLNRTSGTVVGRFTGGTARTGTGRSANGTFTQRLLVNTGNNEVELCLTTSGTLSVDNVSLVGPYNTATVGGT